MRRRNPEPAEPRAVIYQLWSSGLIFSDLKDHSISKYGFIIASKANYAEETNTSRDRSPDPRPSRVYGPVVKFCLTLLVVLAVTTIALMGVSAVRQHSNESRLGTGASHESTRHSSSNVSKPSGSICDEVTLPQLIDFGGVSIGIAVDPVGRRLPVRVAHVLGQANQGLQIKPTVKQETPGKPGASC